MSTSNPWTIYAVVLASALLIYYTFVGWKFYTKETRSLFKGKAKNRDIKFTSHSYQVKPSEHGEMGPDPLVHGEQPAWENEALFTEVEALAGHLAIEIEEAHQKGYNKQDLVQMLQMILKEYSALKGTPFQFAINNRIDAECAKYGLLHLGEGDKGEIWSMV